MQAIVRVGLGSCRCTETAASSQLLSYQLERLPSLLGSIRIFPITLMLKRGWRFAIKLEPYARGVATSGKSGFTSV